MEEMRQVSADIQASLDQEMQALAQQEEATAKAARMLAQEERARYAAVAREEARRALEEHKELEAEDSRSASVLSVWTTTLASSVQREASTEEEKEAQKQASDVLEQAQAEMRRLATGIVCSFVHVLFFTSLMELHCN